MMMMKEVAEAFANREHALIEAPPGIGKRLATLFRRAFAKKSKSRLLSARIQRFAAEILTKDLPIVQDLFPFPVTAAILKGQSHYLCLYKFEQVLHEDDDNYDAVLTKAQLLVWLTETNTGDVAELNLPSGGKLLWDRLAYDDDSYKRSRNESVTGFYERAKQIAMRSDLVITNHSLC